MEEQNLTSAKMPTLKKPIIFVDEKISNGYLIYLKFPSSEDKNFVGTTEKLSSNLISMISLEFRK